MAKIRTGRKRRPRRLLCYGPGGIGKSTFALMLAAALNLRSLFMSLEEGTDDLNVDGATDLFTNAAAAKLFLSDFAEGDEDYRQFHNGMLIVDTIDDWQRLVEAQVAEKFGVSDPKEVDWGKGKAAVNGEMKKLIEGFNYVQRKTGCWIVLLAHESVMRYDDPRSEPYDRYRPALYEETGEDLMGWCDEVIFANYDIDTASSDVGFNRQRNRAIGDGQRYMFTSEQATHKAKRRFNMPNKLPFHAGHYVEHLKAHYASGANDAPVDPPADQPTASELAQGAAAVREPIDDPMRNDQPTQEEAPAA